jgi:hypothetical protein
MRTGSGFLFSLHLAETFWAINRAILARHKTQPGLHAADTAYSNAFFAGHFPYLPQSVGKTVSTIQRRDVTTALRKKISLCIAHIQSAATTPADHTR